MVFYSKYLQLLLLFSKTPLSHLVLFPLVLQNSPLFNYPKSYHHDLNNKNLQFKLTKFLDWSLSYLPCSSKITYSSYPLNKNQPPSLILVIIKVRSRGKFPPNSTTFIYQINSSFSWFQN
jgi:hypothetical protein